MRPLAKKAQPRRFGTDLCRTATVSVQCNDTAHTSSTSDLVQEAKYLAGLHAQIAPAEWQIPLTTWTQIKTKAMGVQPKTQLTKVKPKCKFIDETGRVKAKVKGCTSVVAKSFVVVHNGRSKYKWQKYETGKVRRSGAPKRTLSDKKCGGVVKSATVNTRGLGSARYRWHEYASAAAAQEVEVPDTTPVAFKALIQYLVADKFSAA